MKLTHTIREAFIRAVLQDVPTTDFNEQARKLLLVDSIGQLPPKIRTLARSAETAPFLRTVDYWANLSELGIYRVYCASGDKYKPSPEARAALEKLNAAKQEQSASIQALREKLKAVAYSFTTRKALVEALPEFEKYLPADAPAAVRSLPVVANVVTDFVKAGWPKKGGAA